MVVDDDPAVVRLCQLVLERDGYRVVGAYNAAECLDSLNQRTVDLILLDLMLEDMSGWDLLSHIEETGRLGSARVIIVSGHPLAQSSRKGPLVGYIQKPFAVNVLLSQVRHALNGGGNGHN